MKILVIDDDEGVIEMLKNFLEFEKHEALTAGTAADGIKLASHGDISLVLLDIHLPDMDGIECLKKLHALDKSLPIVMMTAYKEAEKVVDAFREGAVDCLLKPFNFEYLKANILTKAFRKPLA